MMKLRSLSYLFSLGIVMPSVAVASIGTIDFTTASTAIGEPGGTYTYQDVDLYGDGSLTFDLTLTAGGATGGLDHIAQGWGHTNGNDQLGAGESITLSFSDIQGTAAVGVTGFRFVGFVSWLDNGSVLVLNDDDSVTVNGVSLTSYHTAQTAVPDLNFAENGSYDLEDDFTGDTSLLNINTDGVFTITTGTDSFRFAGFQLEAGAITAPEPPAPVAPSPPSHPDRAVKVFFSPITTDTVVTDSDMDDSTVGGSWINQLSDVSKFTASNGGFHYLMDGSNSEGDYVELVLDTPLDFSQNEVGINFELLAAREDANGAKTITVTGFDGNDAIFHITYVSDDVNTENFITATSSDGAESMGATPLKWITDGSIPSGLQDFRVTLENGQVTFKGSSLDTQAGPVLNGTDTLTSLRWEITGAVTTSQGFWLDDVQIRDGRSETRAATERPNVIFILMDDLGYKDLSSYGATVVETTNLDLLAQNGLMSTNFSAAANVCSPSRAAFLTGAYPQRCGNPVAISINGNNRWFTGLNPEEITVAEQFKKQGFKTSMLGKWHLGWHDRFLPRNQGFDHYYGAEGNLAANVPFMDDNEELFPGTPPEDILTALYTEEICSQIREYRDRPFFIYYAHNYPHSPFTEGNAFDGATGNGTRSDVMKELDWSVGQVVAELEANGILENTLIIFSSDNGATSNTNNLPYRGTKYVTYEGGHRVPFFMYWKGQIQPAVTDTHITAMDVFPTISEIIDESVPADRVYDGVSLVPLMNGGSLSRSFDEPFYYYNGENLQAVRKGDWKLHVPRASEQRPWWDKQAESTVYRLYNLATDEGESDDVSSSNQSTLDELTALADQIRLELGEYQTQGTGERPTGNLFPEVTLNLNNVAAWSALPAEERGRASTTPHSNVYQVRSIFASNTNSLVGEYTAGTNTPPPGWEYLEGVAPNSGSVISATMDALNLVSSVGDQGNTGFTGAGNAIVLLEDTTSSFVIDAANTGNGAVAGADTLLSPGVGGLVAARYTIDSEDVVLGYGDASIAGSFRDLVGGASDDSVRVYVFHNSSLLFSASGANGMLSQADGTFSISNLSVQKGDTISFIVNSLGSVEGDEVALRATIDTEKPVEPEAMGVTLNSVDTVMSNIVGLQIYATAGFSYQIEQTNDLSDSDSWKVVDEITFFPQQQPFNASLPLQQTSDHMFWRVVWEN